LIIGMTFRSDFLDGVKDVAPLLFAAATVGLVTGVEGVAVNLHPLQVLIMSVFVYSVTVMLTAFQLLEEGVPTLILVFTSLIVGLRFMIVSLSISSYFRKLSTRWKLFLAYFLWTPIYALSVKRYEDKPETSRQGYYMGLAAPTWVVYVVALVFIYLLIRMLKSMSSIAGAVVSGVLAVISLGVPYKLGIIVAVIGGTIIATILDFKEGS
jgi:predicted branched-subunit amino acid permease